MKQESNRQRTMEDTDGGLHPAVDGQSVGGKDEKRASLRLSIVKRPWRT